VTDQLQEKPKPEHQRGHSTCRQKNTKNKKMLQTKKAFHCRKKDEPKYPTRTRRNATTQESKNAAHPGNHH